jgi:hypothetical protein
MDVTPQVSPAPANNVEPRRGIPVRLPRGLCAEAR